MATAREMSVRMKADTCGGGARASVSSTGGTSGSRRGAASVLEGRHLRAAGRAHALWAMQLKATGAVPVRMKADTCVRRYVRMHHGQYN